MRIAWSPTLGYADPMREIVDLCEQAVRTFEDLGCEVELVDEVMERDPVDMWMSEFYASIGTRLNPVLSARRELLDPAVAEVLGSALDRKIDEYWTQVFNRYRFREDMRRFMETYDLLVSPVLPVPAIDVGLNVPPRMPDANVVSWVQLYVSVQPDRPARRDAAGRVHRRRPAGGTAARLEITR